MQILILYSFLKKISEHDFCGSFPSLLYVAHLIFTAVRVQAVPPWSVEPNLDHDHLLVVFYFKKEAFPVYRIICQNLHKTLDEYLDTEHLSKLIR